MYANRPVKTIDNNLFVQAGGRATPDGRRRGLRALPVMRRFSRCGRSCFHVLSG